jgi:hypothetical protein
VLLYQFRFALLLAAGLLTWETIIKFKEPDSQYVTSDDEALITVNVAVASLCLAAVLAMGGLLLWRVRAGGRAGGRVGGCWGSSGAVWSKRRPASAGMLCAGSGVCTSCAQHCLLEL